MLYFLYQLMMETPSFTVGSDRSRSFVSFESFDIPLQLSNESLNVPTFRCAAPTPYSVTCWHATVSIQTKSRVIRTLYLSETSCKSNEPL